MRDLEPSFFMTVRSFHEAAHAVAAIELGMLDVTVRLVPNRSVRGVSTDADITFVCPALSNEPASRTLERRLIVMLAGPEWELFAALRSSRRQILREQRDDGIAILKVIRDLRNHCGMHGRVLKGCIEDAWKEATRIRSLRNDQLINIAEALDARGVLDDSELRAFF